jgi:predicted nucleic acid-binding protein
MRIIIDTNVLLSDLKFKSEKTRLLIEYAARTENPILVPEVVLKEAEAHVERLLTRQASAFAEAGLWVESCSGAAFQRPNFPDPSALAKQYITRIREKYRISDERIVKADASFLGELIDRATKRKKPFSDQGQEFRDGVIWLSLLQLGKEQNRPVELCFISQNTREFGTDGNLFPELVEEARANNLALQYFPSVDAFLKVHAERIAFITRELLLRLLPVEQVQLKALPLLNSGRAFERFARRFGDAHYEATGNIEVASVALDLQDFYVYPAMERDEYSVIAVYEGIADIYGEVNRWPYEYDYSPDERLYSYDAATEWADASVSLDVEIRLRRDQLLKWEISEVRPLWG